MKRKVIDQTSLAQTSPPLSQTSGSETVVIQRHDQTWKGVRAA